MLTINKYNMISIIFLAIFFVSCTTPDMDPLEEEMIAPICMHDSIKVDTMYFDLGGDILKLPSVFTPDDDGDTDFFYPVFDRSGKEIWISQYSILTPENDWSDTRVIYSAQVLTYEEDKVLRAWDGISDSVYEPYLEEHEGTFRFRFFASREDGTSITCRGWGCVDRTK